ncbi:MAG TPA: hypothetical protein VMU04_09330 [Candidatus Acidoferrum sp.]|nr:hypothetical protein [Candidatus Acidoferrum sp.]
MIGLKRFTSETRPGNPPARRLFGRAARQALFLLLAASGPGVLASENVPQLPFAEWANVPAEGQFILGAVYEQSKSYEIWANGVQYQAKVRSGGENYGIDIRQGYFALQYGITERWAADLEFGGTTVGWRAFDPGNNVESTIGLIDTALGVRYQIFNEAQCTNSPWIPTLTFRAGAVLPGTYSQSIAYAPGFRSAAIQPELLARKHFGWRGLGAYFDAFYRWNMTTENDNYMVAVGFFQQIRGWELDAGYQHLQTLSGSDITFGVPGVLPTLIYPRDVREIRDSIQAGFSYTTSKRHWKYGFHADIVVDGNNSDNKPWFGASIEIPIQILH